MPDLRVEIAKCDREGDLEPGLGGALPPRRVTSAFIRAGGTTGTRQTRAEQCPLTTHHVNDVDQFTALLVCASANGAAARLCGRTAHAGQRAASRGSPALRRSGLRLSVAGSPIDPAESSSLSYGRLPLLLLLSTPPRGDAVTVRYRPEWACLKGTLTLPAKHARGPEEHEHVFLISGASRSAATVFPAWL